ncbi:AAA family ATPase [Nocardioides sp.]|uniref:AAA family ATPase n=1 Tax=Nocardioides sp. TaxID=35761 RepID=UPI002F410D2C
MVVVLVVAAGAAWESPVLERIGARSGMVVLKRCVDVDELLATSSAGQADAAVVALDAPGLDPPAVEVLHRHQVRVVAVAPDTEESRSRAARIGVDALVDRNELDGLPDALEDENDGPAFDLAVLDDADLPPDPDDSGHVIAVWGPGGAPGRTTVAAGVASALARRGLRTTLVDADPYGGSVAQHLGVLDEVSGLLSAARLTGEGALEARFGSIGRALGGRLTVVTGLPRADRWLEVRAGVVEHLLEVARAHGYVVADTGFSLEDDPAGDLVARPGRNQLTLGTLEVADEVLVVGTADPVGLSRLARGLVDLREHRAGAPVRVVVNRMRPNLGWSEREIVGMVEGFARLAGVHFLPDDRDAVDRALTSGTSVPDAGDTPLARALTALADAVVPPPAPHRRRHGGRLLRRRTAGTGRRR